MEPIRQKGECNPVIKWQVSSGAISLDFHCKCKLINVCTSHIFASAWLLRKRSRKDRATSKEEECTEFPANSIATPSQVIALAANAVRAEAFNPATLFLFGSTSLAQDSLGLAVAAALQQKLYIGRAKRKTVASLQLPEEADILLTYEHTQAKLHAVCMRDVSFKGMQRIMRAYRGQFTTLIAFHPHGSLPGSVHGKRQQQGPLITYFIPYSLV